MSKKKYGQYTVGLGSEFNVRFKPQHFGYNFALIGYLHYVIHAPTGKVMGA